MQRYFLQLSYDGTNYAGWQIQPNATTIQQVLSEKLSLMLGEQIQITGAGRTDAGVHASQYFAHFDSRIEDLQTDSKFIFKLNTFLPKDIAIQRIIPVKADAHARFDASLRTYKYYINKHKNVFTKLHAHCIYGYLDVDKMNRAANDLIGEHDFTSFSKKHSDNLNSICTVKFASWTSNEDELVFYIGANRFLRGMVRLITGTLLQVGKGKLNISDFNELFSQKSYNVISYTVPAKGLFLSSIEYPSEIIR